MSTIDPDRNEELSAAIREMASGLHQAGLMPEDTTREIEELLSNPIGNIVLSERDFVLFVETLDNPKPPTAELIAARKRDRDIQVPSEKENGWL